MDVLHPTSTRHFVDAECRCHRGVQAGGDATQRNPHQVVTVAPGEQGESLTFGTGHQNERPLQIHIEQCRITFGSKTDDAVARIFEFLQ